MLLALFELFGSVSLEVKATTVSVIGKAALYWESTFIASDSTKLQAR